MIVDFSVEDELITLGGRDHRLMTGRAQIDDGQPQVPKRHADFTIRPTPLAVRTPMGDSLRHGFQGAERDVLVVTGDDGDESAHAPKPDYRRMLREWRDLSVGGTVLEVGEAS